MKGMEQPQSIEKAESKPKARKILRKKKPEEFWAISDDDSARLVHVK